MAQRRMLSKKITDTDTFLDMPLSTQALYFHLNMHADDDGFVSNVRTINRMVGGSEDDLKILMAKQFIFTFDSGVVVIRDWKIHNYIRKDTYNSTIYGNEKAQLGEDENGSYTFRGRAVDEPSPQVRLGKVRLGKDSKTYSPEKKDSGQTSDKRTPEIDIDIEKEIDIDIKKKVRHKHGRYKNVLLTDEQLDKLKNEFPSDYQTRIENVSEYCQSHGKTYKDYLATIRNWARREKKSTTSKRYNHFEGEKEDTIYQDDLPF